jgi:hypothetical protein
MDGPGELTLCRLACGALPGVEADHEPLRSETGSIRIDGNHSQVTVV